MDYTSSLAVLRRLPIFEKLDTASQKLLAFSCAHVCYQPDEVLVREGDPTESVYVIDEGEVDVSIHRQGRDLLIARLGRHQIFGEMAVLRGGPRTATVRAVDRVTVLRIDGDVFIQLITGNANAALSVMQDLIDKLVVMTERYETLKRSMCAASGGANPTTDPIFSGDEARSQ